MFYSLPQTRKKTHTTYTYFGGVFNGECSIAQTKPASKQKGRRERDIETSNKGYALSFSRYMYLS